MIYKKSFIFCAASSFVFFMSACSHTLVNTEELRAITSRLDVIDTKISKPPSAEVLERHNELVSLANENLQEQKLLTAEIATLKEEIVNLKLKEQAKIEKKRVVYTKKSPQVQQLKSDKKIVGRVESVLIDPPGIKMKARIDTGAHTSSINAKDIVRFERDQKKWVRFTLIDEKNNTEHVIERRVARVAKIIQSSQDDGFDKRVVVTLQITLGDMKQLSEFTLTDREHMTYSVLVGRNVLRDQMLVDVAKKDLLSLPQTQKKQNSESKKSAK